jgi:hypothetical protein
MKMIFLQARAEKSVETAAKAVAAAPLAFRALWAIIVRFFR